MPCTDSPGDGPAGPPQLGRGFSQFPKSILHYTAEMTPTRARQSLVPVATFGAALAVAVAATCAAVDRLPAFVGLRPGIEAGARPTDGDHYLANDIGGHVDHHVIYFGTDAAVVRHLKAAEVLFLGNSRLMFALRPDVLRPFFADRQRTYYVMGFGYREADAFPLAILRRFDLRPRLVVVNADGFFGGGLSPWAEEVVRDTPFGARKRQWESEATHEARRLTQVLFPHWPSFLALPGVGNLDTFTAYRSRQDGTWDISPWRAAGHTFQPAPLEGPGVGESEAREADAFVAELLARGARLVLTRVPTPVAMPGAGAAETARRLGVPLLVANVTAPTSVDHSHLDAASAHDWTRAFLDQLAPEIDRLDGPDDEGSPR